MNNKQKLELTWIGKNNPEYDIANIEPRILEEKPELSNCANDPKTENMVIHGDNLLALKALLPEYEGKVKCIYIDPPYNTGSAFEYYDDAVEHSTWLSLMRPRLELLRMLLSDDGAILVQIDDQEAHYLKVLMDEVFSRNNFIASISVRSSTPSGLKTAHREKTIIKQKDHILVYKNDGELNIRPAYIRKEDKWDGHFAFYFDIQNNQIIKLIDILKREKIVDAKATIHSLDSSDIKFKKFYLDNSDRIFRTQPTLPLEAKEQSLRHKDQVIQYFDSSNNKNYAVNGARLAFLSDSIYTLDDGTRDLGMLLCDFWSDIDFQNTQNEGGVKFPASKKPERLIQRILGMFTNENEIILDSFLGSGTTAAVAQKLNRKYIGIEMGEHAYTHCVARLNNVISGDQSGISRSVSWKGGGAYRFYELAPSFIDKDEFGNQVIDVHYNDTKLIKAMCKLMNFTYQPNGNEYWKQGFGHGKNYLYVTTQLLTSGMVQQIASNLKEGESLVICPKKFEAGAEKVDSRITVKKIPQSILKACHFGKKEYLLPIKETALEEIDSEEEEDAE